MTTSASVNDEQMAALRALADRLRDSAPWDHVERMGFVHSRGTLAGGCQMRPGGYRVADIRGHGHLGYRIDGDEIQTATGDFIAAADPATVLALIDEIQRLRAQVRP